MLQAPLCDWAQHLLDAFKILHQEQRLSEQVAKKITAECAAAAVECVQAHNHQVLAAARRALQNTFQKVCAAIANCLQYAPSRIRKKLDFDISVLLRDRSVDLEFIEEILALVAPVLRNIPANKKPEIVIKAIALSQLKDFHALEPSVLENCYDGLGSFVRQAQAGATFRGKDVLMVLANAIGRDKPSKIHLRPYDNERRLISAITPLCRAAGLGTLPTANYLNPERRTKFIRFANFIYAGALEMMGERSDGSGLPYRHTNEKPQTDTESGSKKSSDVTSLPGSDLNLITYHRLRK
jgi:hypothetical protein